MTWVLQESKRNVLKDFVHIAGPLGVTQFLILTATENACYLRIAKAPRVSHFLLNKHSCVSGANTAVQLRLLSWSRPYLAGVLALTAGCYSNCPSSAGDLGHDMSLHYITSQNIACISVCVSALRGTEILSSW